MPGDFGTKHSGTATIGAVTATTFSLTASPSEECFGDSGGRAFITVAGVEYLAGVTSHGDLECTSSDADTRIDAYGSSFVAPFIAQASDGAAAAGQACFFPGNCADGACTVAPDDPQFLYCAPPCGASGGCPAGMSCTPSDAGRAGEFPVPTPGAQGSTCKTDADCVALRCEEGICTSLCVLSSDCPTGYECDEVGEECR